MKFGTGSNAEWTQKYGAGVSTKWHTYVHTYKYTNISDFQLCYPCRLYWNSTATNHHYLEETVVQQLSNCLILLKALVSISDKADCIENSAAATSFVYQKDAVLKYILTWFINKLLLLVMLYFSFGLEDARIKF